MYIFSLRMSMMSWRLRMNEAKTMSTPCSMPKRRSPWIDRVNEEGTLKKRSEKESVWCDAMEIYIFASHTRNRNKLKQTFLEKENIHTNIHTYIYTHIYSLFFPYGSMCELLTWATIIDFPPPTIYATPHCCISFHIPTLPHTQLIRNLWRS